MYVASIKNDCPRIEFVTRAILFRDRLRLRVTVFDGDPNFFNQNSGLFRCISQLVSVGEVVRIWDWRYLANEIIHLLCRATFHWCVNEAFKFHLKEVRVGIAIGRSESYYALFH